MTAALKLLPPAALLHQLASGQQPFQQTVEVRLAETALIDIVPDDISRETTTPNPGCVQGGGQGWAPVGRGSLGGPEKLPDSAGGNEVATKRPRKESSLPGSQTPTQRQNQTGHPFSSPESPVEIHRPSSSKKRSKHSTTSKSSKDPASQILALACQSHWPHSATSSQ